MPLPKRILGKTYIARDGTNLGIHEGDNIRDLLESGQLLPTDHFYDEKSGTWIPLSELDSAEDPPAAPSSPSPASPSSSSSSGESPSGERRSSSRGGRGRSRKREGPALGGWIASLFALGAAAGLWAWNQNLSSGLDFANEKVKEQAAVIEQLRSRIELLSELTPPGKVRAIITYAPSPDNTAIVSGATVQMYRRATIEAALQKLPSGIIASEEKLFAILSQLQAILPPPLEVAVTKSNGRVEIPVPEPGAYVLLTSTAKSTGQQLIRFLWLIGFESSDQPSKIILMNESNAISRYNLDLAITDVQSDLSQPSPPGR